MWDHCNFANNLENGETRLSSLLSGRGKNFDDVMAKTRPGRSGSARPKPDDCDEIAAMMRSQL